jgi:hypothetical protein
MEEKGMKIYIATSWKNKKVARTVTEAFRMDGHEVDCFCDRTSGRYVFHWSEFVKNEGELKNYDAISFLLDPRTQKAFNEDKKWLDWAEAIVMIQPCGKSAHLEAGYAKGCGKKLYLWGEFPKGEVDVMYGFADKLFRTEDFSSLRDILIVKNDL